MVTLFFDFVWLYLNKKQRLWKGGVAATLPAKYDTKTQSLLGWYNQNLSMFNVSYLICFTKLQWQTAPPQWKIKLSDANFLMKRKTLYLQLILRY